MTDPSQELNHVQANAVAFTNIAKFLHTVMKTILQARKHVTIQNIHQVTTLQTFEKF